MDRLDSQTWSHRRSLTSLPFHRDHSYYMTNPTIELNNDKCLKRVDEDIFKQSYKQTPMYLNTGLVMCTSSSTPDFRHYNQHNQSAKQNKTSEKEIKYQNLSSLDTFDTMNHTFPKQNISLNKSDSSENKGSADNVREYPFLMILSSRWQLQKIPKKILPRVPDTVPPFWVLEVLKYDVHKTGNILFEFLDDTFMRYFGHSSWVGITSLNGCELYILLLWRRLSANGYC